MERGFCLEGVRVLEFQWALAGPLATAYLAEFGAEVIRVESEAHVDVLRVSPPYKGGAQNINNSFSYAVANNTKKSVALDLKSAHGKEVAHRLVEWADVVCESMTPDTMKRWGLGYDDLRKVKANIIMVSSSLQGQTGPRAKSSGFGPQLAGLSGFINVTGWPDRLSVSPNIGYPDFLAPWFEVVVILAALDFRARTGKGQYIDLSQLEASLSFLSVPLLDYGANEHCQCRCGNRDPLGAPHGVYPCHGDDRWCAIAIFSEEEWDSFCEVLGRPSWSRDARFATLQARKVNEDELDRLVSAWTIDFTPEEVMARMQKAGIAAGTVENARDLVEKDVQLSHWNMFTSVRHPFLGDLPHYGWPVRMSDAITRAHPAAMLGEHTEEVMREVLKLSDEKIVSFLNNGTLQ